MGTRMMVSLLAALALGLPGLCEDLPLGRIVDSVECKADAQQHYALYLPSHYSNQRLWGVIFLFDAGGRGRRGVERYQAAAEKYGYILAGSNNSRNGPWDVSMAAAKAMMGDIDQRFTIDPQRLYTAGMSGGARVAMKVALDSKGLIAGVIASSAGFPNGPRRVVPFPIFASVGTEDFNYLEMRTLDRTVTSPHRVMLFDGPHTWLPAELATQAVEWMELQAIKSGKLAREDDSRDEMIDKLFAIRVAQIESDPDSLSKLRDLRAIVTDFEGFKEVGEYGVRAAEMMSQKDTKDAVREENLEARRETQFATEVYTLRDSLDADPSSHDAKLVRLRELLQELAAQSKAAEDSSIRRVARRVLAGVGASSRGVEDPGFQELLKEIRPPQPAQ